jgi:hypothetical protein
MTAATKKAICLVVVVGLVESIGMAELVRKEKPNGNSLFH